MSAFQVASLFLMLHALQVMSEMFGKTPAGAEPPFSFNLRHEIPTHLEKEGFKIGAELGVQSGAYAAETLQLWKSCEKYYLIDVWKHQVNYKEGANVPDDQQEKVYQSALTRTEPFKNKIVVLRMLTSEAVAHIPDGTLDYVYIDARHDYCGVHEDIMNYWPKVRSGGIVAGHDFYTAEDHQKFRPKEDWGLCGNGTYNQRAVKGAVLDFARSQSVQVSVGTGSYPSWVIRKP